MDAPEGMALLEYAMTQEADALLFQRWIQGPQASMSFDEFKRELMAAAQRTEPINVGKVLEDVGDILHAFESERGEHIGNL